MKSFWKNKRVLVTGGSGFIGRYAVKKLVDLDSKVCTVVTPNNASDNHRRIFGTYLDTISVRKLDLLIPENFVEATKDVDIVLNFAAMDGGAAYKRTHSSDIFHVNTRLILNLFEACRINHIERVLIMSSVNIYPVDAESPITEKDAYSDMVRLDSNGYEWSKRFSEIAATIYCSQYNIKAAIARVGNVYGPEDYTVNDKGRIIPTFIQKARKNENITIWNDGNIRKSFLHVSDLVTALLDLTEKYAECTPVNIAGTQYVTLKELAEHIIELSSSSSKITCMKNSHIIGADRIISVEKAKECIGFTETIPLRKGLELLYEAA